MKLLDSLTVQHGTEVRSIELYLGDIVLVPAELEVDVLVISAFPNDYGPSPGSIISALAQVGISVEKLARTKEVDLRLAFSCWWSNKLDVRQHFERILCFEPLVRGRPTEVVGDIFRSLAPLLGEKSRSAVVAMPLVASGDQQSDPAAMLKALVDAAAHWMTIGLPMSRLIIVERSPEKAPYLGEVFAKAKSKYVAVNKDKLREFRYDVLISYAREDARAVDILAQGLEQSVPGSRIFLDRRTLKVGSAWQQELFEALDACRRIVALYSPDYLLSKVCLEEFNIGWARQRESTEAVLFPILVYTTSLPTYMRLIQYEDCREGDERKLSAAARRLGSSLQAFG